jgi:recombination protein RecT
MSTALANKSASPATQLSAFMDKHKSQIAIALPKHITADRMVRLAMTSFSQNKALQSCDMNSIFASVVIAAQLGLEIGVGGQGYLVPYKGKATFVPGWQGLVDLVSRAGRATVWTGAVYAGDQFDWALGDNPFVKHQPNGDGDHWKQITHVYAIGRVNGSQYPVIEVWTMDRVIRHLNKYNKVGGSHYALSNDGQNMEMYARKVVLLQVLKYMPKSIEVQKAVDAAQATDSGKNFTIDGDMVLVQDDQSDPAEQVDNIHMPQSRSQQAQTVESKEANPNAPLTPTQIDFIKSKMEMDALGTADLFKKFGKKAEEFTQCEFDSVVAWIKNPD